MTDSNESNTPPGQAPKKGPDKSNIFMAMGIEAFVAVLGGFWIGQYVDKYLGNKGMGPAFGSILFLIAWFVHLLQVMKRYDEEP
jgi:uncharacterized BrkB/YihY/UPF0761 family membrane protein